MLEHHTDFLPDFSDMLGVFSQLGAFNYQSPGTVFLQAVNASDQRRFSRTRRAANDYFLPCVYVQADVRQCLEGSVEFIDLLYRNYQIISIFCHQRILFSVPMFIQQINTHQSIFWPFVLRDADCTHKKWPTLCAHGQNSPTCASVPELYRQTAFHLVS